MNNPSVPVNILEFAVVIPAFNDQDTVCDAITSAINQPGIAEVIVVDDGSTDLTLERAREARGPVRCISQPNAGPAAARNSGAFSADADYVVFLDADDVLLSGALERFARAHADGAALVRAASHTHATDGSSVIAQPQRSVHPFPRGTPLAGTFSVDASLFRDVSGYDPLLRFGENSDLVMRLSARLGPESDRIAFVQAPSVEVRPRAGRVHTHYDEVRLAAVDRMLEVHRQELLMDDETLRSHLLIASMLHRRQGRRSQAVRLAYRAAFVGAPTPRDLYRILSGRNATSR